MSNIFDALQRAETETAGAESPSISIAMELLEAAESRFIGAGLKETPEVPDKQQRPTLGQFDNSPQLAVSIREENHLVSVAQEGSLGAEKFRFFALRLRQLRNARPLKKVLITSTIPEEGKSTVAANLACTLARRKQQKTLLLEGDLRRPNITHQFGVGKLPGLCEWLSEKTHDVGIYKLQSLGLWLLPAGAAPENPLELMQSGRLSLLMEQLEARFDWIIIDSPPVLPLGDTSVWSRFADGIVLVTRKGVTEKQQLSRGLEVIDKSKLLGALVNSSSTAARSDYYKHYAAGLLEQAKSNSSK
jgi:capsular exopolysaccharide synthesis family protein